MANKYSEVLYEIFTIFNQSRENVGELEKGYRKSFYDRMSLEVVPYDGRQSSSINIGLIRGNYLPQVDPITHNAISVDHVLESFYLPSIPELLGFSTQYLADSRLSLGDLFFKVTVSDFYLKEFEKRLDYIMNQTMTEFIGIFSDPIRYNGFQRERYEEIRTYIFYTLQDVKYNVQIAKKLTGGRFIMRLRKEPKIEVTFG